MLSGMSSYGGCRWSQSFDDDVAVHDASFAGTVRFQDLSMRCH